MKVKINNIAKVLEAEISANGITVIAGLNNTGKSTILKAFYLSVNTFRNSSQKVFYERQNSIANVIRKAESYFDEKGYEFLPTSLLYEFTIQLNNNLNKFLENPENFNYFKKIFYKCLDRYRDSYNIKEESDIYSDEFLFPIFEKVKKIFLRPREEYVEYIGNMYIRDIFNNEANNVQNLSEAGIQLESENGENFIYIKDNKIIKMSYASINQPDAIYLPAYNMLDYINKNSIIRKLYSPEYTMNRYLLEEIQQVQAYEEYSEIENNINIIREILEEVVHGKLEKSQFDELVFRDDEIDSLISTNNIASGIKNFLIIQSLVEKGKLKRNSILLIDEPETNLHPEWHLVFAEILVLMYKNMGVVSIVNSHSPYFIRAIEVKMADHGIKDRGSYYLMQKNEKNEYIAEDVTNATDKIYQKLYKPLEYL